MSMMHVFADTAMAILCRNGNRSLARGRFFVLMPL